MSQENVEVFRRATDAFNSDDVDALDEFITEDFEFFPYLATQLERRSFRGHAAQREYQAERHATWESLTASIEEIRDLGDRVIAFGELSGRGKTTGVEVRVPIAWTVDFVDGRISRLESFGSPGEALAAAGLSE